MRNIITAIALTLLASSAAYAAPSDLPNRGPRGKADAGYAPAHSDLIEVATCKDGTKMWAPTNEHRGACRGHGGVASWADGSPVRTRKGSREYR